MSIKSLCLCFTILLLVTLIVGRRHTSATPPLEEATMPPAACFNPSARIPLTGKTCGPVPDLQLSCYLPSDMVPSPAPSPTSTRNFNTLQRSADIFSWQEFFALNWPAQTGMRGEPDVNKKISDPGARVWETWKEEYEVYLKNGDKPKPWNDSEPVPGGVRKSHVPHAENPRRDGLNCASRCLRWEAAGHAHGSERQSCSLRDSPQPGALRLCRATSTLQRRATGHGNVRQLSQRRDSD